MTLLPVTLADLQTKAASDATPSYGLSGQLVVSKSGWLMLTVPNDIVRGLFAAMDENGVELPLNDEGKLNAHISVMRPEELERIGGPDRVTERGKHFHYSIGRLLSAEPGGWKEMERAWFCVCHSPELMELRRSYGLSGLPNDGQYQFHITIAVRRRKVLTSAPVSKAPQDAGFVVSAAYQEPSSRLTHDGEQYDLNVLLQRTADQPLVHHPVAPLEWVLNHATPYPQRLAAADTASPILIAPDRHGRPTVIDGLHRLAKKRQEQGTSIPAKLVSPADLAAARLTAKAGALHDTDEEVLARLREA